MIFGYIQENNIDNLKKATDLETQINSFDKNGETPLFIAAYKGYSEIVKYLTEQGADINKINKNELKFTPLHGAVIGDNFEVVKYLLSKKAKTEQIDKYGNTPLYLAGTHAQIEISRLLINAGANLNTKNDSGNNIIHTICLYAKETSENIDKHINPEIGEATTFEKYFDTLQLFITHGAKINAPNIDEFSPLHLAAVTDTIDFVQLLDMHKCDLNITTSSGYAPIHLACRNNSLNTADYLIKRKVNLNIQDEFGISPLHEACDEGNFEIVEKLIHAGANKSLTISKSYDDIIQGFTALDIARLRKFQKIIDFLQHS